MRPHEEETVGGIADYEFIRSLGQGNHGEFFLARRPPRLPVDVEFVAVKVLTGPTSEDAFRRATRELAAFAAVRSPHLVTLYDAGQQGAACYYSMEHLPGGSLAAPAAPVPRSAALAAVADAARAAHALHEAGIVHRDVKPGNVLLADGGGGRLSDLGLSQVLAPGVTVTGMGALPSVEFMEPDLLRGEAPARASDVFSLGVTLHRVLTDRGMYGELPAHDPVLALRRVFAQPPRVDPDLEPGAAAVVRSATAPRRADRPAALELAALIDGLIGH